MKGWLIIWLSCYAMNTWILDKLRKCVNFLKLLWKIWTSAHWERHFSRKKKRIIIHLSYRGNHRRFYLYSLTSSAEVNYKKQKVYFIRNSEVKKLRDTKHWYYRAFCFLTVIFKPIYVILFCCCCCRKTVSTLLSSLTTRELKDNSNLPNQRFYYAIIPSHSWAAFIKWW